MKTLKWSLILCLIPLFLACKDEKKTEDDASKSTEVTNEIQKSYLDKELEDALYNGYFIKNDKGYDIVLKDNFIYLLKSNPTEVDKTAKFFLHAIPQKGTLINLDFAPTEHSINSELSDNYSNVLVYKRELPKMDVAYSINVGQFTAEKRTWENYIQVSNLNQVANKYKNEYVQNTKNNRYLKEFESAFNEGYFMKQKVGFDLLLNDHTLYYIKLKGSDNDLKDMFFLHVKYDGKEDMKNLDFRGEGYDISSLLGNKFSKFTVVKREIPNAGDISEIDTGQFDKNTRSWSIKYVLSQLYDDMNFIYNDQYKEFLQTSEKE